jgi:hypothetical protein
MVESLAGGPVGKFPTIFFTGSKIRTEKKQKKGAVYGLTMAPFPPHPISMHPSHLPPSTRIAIPSAKKLLILATSWHDAHQGRCRDVTRIGFTVGP